MATNATGYDPSCPSLSWYTEVGEATSFVAYLVSSPCYAILGLLSHVLCLRAFYVQSKKEKAYLYQVSTTVSETVEVLSWMVYVAGFEWITDPLLNINTTWYRSCYVCMRISAKIGTVFINTAITTSLLLSVCMSADRLYALWKPLSYKSVNIKRTCIIAVCTSIFLATITSSYEFFVFFALPQGNGQSENSTVDASTYSYIIAYAPLSPSATDVLSQLRNALQAVALIILYFCNFGLVWFYHLRQVEAAKLLHLRSSEKKRHESEKTLALITICQCICTTLSTTAIIISTVFIFLYPTFRSCSGLLFIPLHDMFIQVIDLCDFFCLVAISKQFRKMLLKQLPFLKDKVPVAPMFQRSAASTSQRPNSTAIGKKAKSSDKNFAANN